MARSKPLCQCLHQKSQHNYDKMHPRFCRPCGRIKLKVDGFMGAFYRVRKCGNYRPMTNLEYLEHMVAKRGQ